MIKPPIALQIYSVRKLWQENPWKAMTFARDCGYTGVEFFGNFYSGKLCRALLDEAGLVCAGWHTGIEALEGDQFEKTLRLNIEVGNKYICVPWFNADSIDGWKKFCDRLNAVAEKLAKYGMKTGYHNHAHEFKPVEGAIPWEIIVKNTDPNVVLQLDTGNCMSSGNGSPADWIKLAEGRNQTIHCKPFSKKDEFISAAGQDDVPWKDIFQFCRTKGATEWFIVEYEADTKVEESVKACCDYLSSL